MACFCLNGIRGGFIFSLFFIFISIVHQKFKIGKMSFKYEKYNFCRNMANITDFVDFLQMATNTPSHDIIKQMKAKIYG